MPPRRGWGIFGLGFYKDVAPTAPGKRDKLHINIARLNVDTFVRAEVIEKCQNVS
jgi:hypothetical protein